MGSMVMIVAAARTGHFGQAARLCNVTQPSLSEQIKKLEEYLDIRIFERTRSGVEVTEPGRRIVAMVAWELLGRGLYPLGLLRSLRLLPLPISDHEALVKQQDTGGKT